MQHTVPIYIIDVIGVIKNDKGKIRPIPDKFSQKLIFKGFTNIIDRNTERVNKIKNDIGKKMKIKKNEKVIINKIILKMQVGYGIND